MALRVRRDDVVGEVATRYSRFASALRLTSALPTLAVLLIAVLLPLATFLVSVWLLGWQLQAVLSGSMAPTYPVGSLLVVAQVDASEVEPGMAIVFEDPEEPGRLVTHRVVAELQTGNLQFVTQGDANLQPDRAPVPARMVRGRVLWHVDDLGTVLTWLAWPRALIFLVLLPGALLAFVEWRARRPGG